MAIMAGAKAIQSQELGTYFWDFQVSSGSQELSSFSNAFSGHSQGVESEEDHLGHEPASVWDADTASGGLIW